MSRHDCVVCFSTRATSIRWKRVKELGLPNVACVAGGSVSAREIKFWRRSRKASGEAARRMGRGTLIRVPLPILLAASPLAFRLRRQNFISRALTLPPATQATLGKPSSFTLFHRIEVALVEKQTTQSCLDIDLTRTGKDQPG